MAGYRKQAPPGSPLLDLSDEALAGQCVFVDNKQSNVTAAAEVGFVGVLYEAYTQTEGDLEAQLTAAGVCLEPLEE